MNMPGFNAEASLCRTRAPYSANGILGQARGTVRPQFGFNSTCLDDCEALCPSVFDCSDAPSSQRAACLRFVAICPTRCRANCRRNRAVRHSRQW